MGKKSSKGMDETYGFLFVHGDIGIMDGHSVARLGMFLLYCIVNTKRGFLLGLP